MKYFSQNQSESSKCPKPKMRQCWVDKNHDSSEKMMSFKDLNKKNHENGRPISSGKKNISLNQITFLMNYVFSASSVSSSCSWYSLRLLISFTYILLFQMKLKVCSK